MKNNTQKSPKYFRHLESGEIYFEGLDQKRKLNLINQKTSSEYYLPGQYGEHDYFPFEEIPQPSAPIKEDADISKISTEELQWRVDNPEGAKWFDAYKESNQQYLQLAELCIKYKEQVNVLREALQLLTNSTNLSKLNIRKDFTLINAHANGLKALKKTETN